MITFDSLYEDQKKGVNLAVNFFKQANSKDKLLLTYPTGTGKSFVLLFLQDLLSIDLQSSPILSPKREIIDGLGFKRGLTVDDLCDEALNLIGLYTVQKFRNKLMDGKITKAIERIFWDEVHHFEAKTWQETDLLCGSPPSLGLTATGFRGTPKGTFDLHQSWGKPIQMLSYPDAIKQQRIVLPDIKIEPLLDDDLVEIVNGEFKVSSITNETGSIIDDAARLIDHYCMNIDKPTIISVSSSQIALMFLEKCKSSLLPITQKTPYATRNLFFENCLNCKNAIIFIDTIGEGIDHRFRRWIDFSPIFSPVKWLQILGRIMRPFSNNGDSQPEYISTNRNLFRHSYLLQGAIPLTTLATMQPLFLPSNRSTVRAVGLECLGKFKPFKFMTSSNIQCDAYFLTTMEHAKKVEYAAIIHPAIDNVFWAKKESIVDGQSYQYGKWVAVEPPNQLEGFKSNHTNRLTDKQATYWKRSAENCGLKVDQPVNNKTFQILPLMINLEIKFK